MATRSQRQPFYVEVANKLIEQLEKGTAPWQKPWKAGELGTRQMPMNPTTGKRYRGINAISLMMTGSDDNRWMTYNQAQKMGAQVMKGAKGMPVQYWQFTEEQAVKDESGKPVFDAQGKPKKQTVNLERPRVFFATVFNGSQIDGLPPLPPVEAVKVEWNPSERAEAILKNSGAEIHHDQSNRAFYRPSSDAIHLPFKENFETADKYYATALHELGHWTGQENRLARDLSHPFGSEGYAKEELRAEISSMIIGMELGIGHDPGQHAAYVKSWIKVLKDDPKEILRASADAEKIHAYVMAFEQKLEQELEPVNQMSAPVPTSWRGEACRHFDEEMGKRLGNPVYYEARSVASMLADYDELSFEPSESTKQFLEERADAISEANLWIKENVLLNPQIKELMYETVRDFGREPGDTLKDTELREYLAEMERLNKRQDEPKQESVQMSNEEFEKIYLDVPYEERQEAKAAGAKWDRSEKSWFYTSSQDAAAFEKWGKAERNQDAAPEKSEASTIERVYIAVPYAERQEAKAAGAKWDKEAKSWFVESGTDAEAIKKWAIRADSQTQDPPKLKPADEFRETMLAMGLDTTPTKGEEHPIKDGKKHRVRALDDKPGAFSGSYVYYDDENPAGHIHNFKRGAGTNWNYKGYSLSDEERAKLAAQAAEKAKLRAEELKVQYDKAASLVGENLKAASPAVNNNPYLTRKGIQAHNGIKQDASGNLVIFAQDINDKVWIAQTVYPDGNKRWTKDAKKEGNFHVIGCEPGQGSKALAKAEVIVCVEGYATGATVKENIEVKNSEVVVLFDTGNISAVVQSIKEKHPQAAMLLAGDDDRHLPLKEIPVPNVGREKAEQAAKDYNVAVVFPEFSSSIPKDKIKDYTDFNDLAKLPNGAALVKRNINKGINKALSKSLGDHESLDQTHKKRISM